MMLGNQLGFGKMSSSWCSIALLLIYAATGGGTNAGAANVKARVIREVSKYGATGNGHSDDTAAINRAIAALRQNETLHFSCGTYVISAALGAVHTNGVTLTGPSNDCVTLKLTGTAELIALRVTGDGLSAARNLSRDTTEN